TFWWALETRSDMKAAASNHGATRSLPPKFTGRVSRWKDERPGKFESNKFELMGKSQQQPGPPVRSEDQDQPDRQIPPPLLANYPTPAPQSRSLQTPTSQSQNLQIRPSSRGDMPLPELPAMAPPVVDQSESAPWQARASAPPMFLPQLPASP